MRKQSCLSWVMLIVFMMTIFGGVGVGVPEASATTLSDIQGHWAQATIQKMADAGVVAGKPDGTFKPNDKITRAEFASLVVNAFKLEKQTGKVFSDTANHWAKDSISTANAHGVVSGYGDKFGADDPVTTEQMAVMVVKAAKLAPSTATLTFKDTAQISAWAKDDVTTAFSNKIIVGGSNGYFNPQSNATRAQAVVVINAALAVPAGPVTPEPPKPAGPDLSKLDKAGTFGPETGTQTVDGSVTISAAEVTLQNAAIKGDLTITDGVGSGDVTVKNVTVNGTTTIKGGGENTVTFDNCKLGKVVINKADGKIRVSLTGTTTVSELVADSACKVVGKGTITKATINKSGVNIEQKPGTFNIASGISAIIAGKTEKETSSGGGGGGGGGGTQYVGTVTVNLAPGAVAAGAEVKLSCATAGATIYYTVDGTNPTTSSLVYSAPIKINADVTIKAISVKSGLTNSAVVTYKYTIGGVKPGDVTAQDLNVSIDQIVPGVLNVTIPFADAQSKLSAANTSTLVLTVPGKAALELAYKAEVLNGAGGFLKAAVQGYSEAEIKAAVATLKAAPPTFITAQDLNAAIDTIVPGVFNITIPFADAQSKLSAANTSTLVLTVPGKAALELTYQAEVLNGAGGFLKAAVQGYSEAEIKAAAATLKEAPPTPPTPPVSATAQELNATFDTIVPGVFNVIIPFADAQTKLNATKTSTLVLTVPGKAALELTYQAEVLNGAGGFLKAAVQGYSTAEISAGAVTVK